VGVPVKSTTGGKPETVNGTNVPKGGANDVMATGKPMVVVDVYEKTELQPTADPARAAAARLEYRLS
jgi:hypothetical protein